MRKGIQVIRGVIPFLGFMALMFYSLAAFAQNTITVKGVVTDPANDPLPGVSIKIEGTTKGGTTNMDGKYTLTVSPKAVLVFSFTGMKTQRIPVKGRTTINVKFEDDDKTLEDLVVIGHGATKKVSISGAITSIKGQELRMPTSSLTSAFAGQIAGVISMATSGAPGSASEFYIRGVSTFGGRATPLIMLDDVEISAGDLNNIPAETIESFSILKDASATAIYGSRGSNGVMLIKTKNGGLNEKTRVNFTFEQSFNTPTLFPDFVDGATWMELYNEASLARNPNATPKYSQDRIDNTRNGVDPYFYPNVDWKSVIFRNMAMNQRANLNVQGGGSKTTYYMSVQVNHDTGLLNSVKAHSFDNNINNLGLNFQNNISYNLTKSTKIDLRMNAQIRNHQGGNYNPVDLFAKIQAANPINFPVTYPRLPGDKHIKFGSSVLSGSNYRENPYASMINSYQERNLNTINTSLKVMQDLDFITKGLKMSLLANYKSFSTSVYNRSIQPYLYGIKNGTYKPDTKEYELERLGTSGTDYIAESAITRGSDQTQLFNATLDYSRTFGVHNVGAMLLYQQRDFRSEILPHRNQGWSGRFQYNYDNRYFVEANFGYTGTERLLKEARFEFFPAISAGWVISDEKFFAPLRDVVSFAKLRASYGLIGNDETGTGAGASHFLYIDRISLATDAMAFTSGEDLNHRRRGPEVSDYAVAGARWEKIRKFNVGIDLRLFKNLNITADYFSDHRYDILLKREAWPQSLGYHSAKPWANKGRLDNSGFEFSVNYDKEIVKDLHLSLRTNVTYTKNKLVDYDDPLYHYTWQIRKGQPLHVIKGYVADGLFSSQEEIDNSPVQNLGSRPMPGDIKYRDITGDGKIDENDQTVISPYSRVPRLQYGFGGTIRYKNFDLGVFFTGSGMRSVMAGLMAPFGQNDQNVFKFIAENRWSEKNPDPNALYPRLGIQTSETANNAPASTYWLRDGSYLRFKQLELGYNFKYGRVYVTGDNLAVFSKFKLWDPELYWNSYPLQRVFNLGVQLRF